MTKLSHLSRSPIRSFTRDMLLELYAIISDSYVKASEACYSDHSAPSARDLLPHKRKATVDDQIKSFADKHGFYARYSKNKIKNCSHIELHCHGELFVIYYVNSKVERPKTRFRNELAQSCYISLPGIEQYHVREGKNFIEILHGPDGKNINELGFVQFVKPSPDMGGDMWSIGIETLLSDNHVVVEEISDTADVKLRRRMKKTEEE